MVVGTFPTFFITSRIFIGLSASAYMIYVARDLALPVPLRK